MAMLLSVNGELSPLNTRVPAFTSRSTPYEPIDIGKPLLMRYLRLSLKHKPGVQNIMLSTFFKGDADKRAASEVVNLHMPIAKFDDKGRLVVNGFPAANYGHPLIYYTKAYTGQPIALTTRMMDLNRSDTAKAVFTALQGAIGANAGIPMFMEFLPYVGMAKVGLSLLEKIYTFLSQDRPLFDDYSVNLEFATPHTRPLQSGRIVCVPGVDDAAVQSSGFSLNEANQLVDGKGEEWVRTSYFVLQIDSKPVSYYENFDYHQGTAELLANTNRAGVPVAAIINDLVDLTKASRDSRNIKDIEDLAVNGVTDENRKEIEAHYRLLSPDMAKVFKARYEELTKPKPNE